MTNAENPDYTIPAQLDDTPEIPDDLNVPEDADDRLFQDLKLLGLGGMGVVYEADDPALERKVALKMLRSPFRRNRKHMARFIKEARITAKIDHPNIIAVHHLGINRECGAYFSMRRIKGETLQTILRKLRENDPAARRQYTLRRLLDIFVAACNGVAAAHQRGICHCDLKPSNIMVGIQGEVWVLDWGVAREKDTPSPAQDSVEGTPAFMAPELLCGKQSVPDEKSDIYALGTVLYSILTWRESPFAPDMEKEELLKNAAAGKVLPLRSPGKEQILQVELAAICRKMMAYERDNRYDNINAVLDDMHNYLDGMPVSAYSPGIFYRFLKFCRRRPLIPAVLTVALATVSLYHLAIKYMDYANDCSQLRQAHFNVRQALEYSTKSMRCWHDLTSPESSIAPLQTALNERDMLLSANLAMLESFAAFDAAAGTSPEAAESFVANDGSRVLKRLLLLQCVTAPAGMALDTLERFQTRWQTLLEKALENDPDLLRLTQLLQHDYGRLIVSGENRESLLRCTLLQSDGLSMPMTFRDRHLMELPSGGNYLHFSRPDGTAFAAFFQINPGAVVRLAIPEVKVYPGFILILQDHWFAEINGVGRILKRLPDFMISASEVSIKSFRQTMPQSPAANSWRDISGKALIRAADAEKYCKLMSKKLKTGFRLPSELELRKSLTPGNLSNESFYGAKPLAENIPVFIRRRGKTAIYNPATKKIEPCRDDSVAALRIVAEIK